MDSVRAGAASAQPRGATDGEVVLEARGVNVYYGDNHALHDTSLEFHKGEITALIGLPVAASRRSYAPSTS